MPNNSPFVASVNELLAKLEDNPTVDTGIELANQIVSLFGEVNTKSVEDVFESSIELPNAERYDSWFQPHPIFKSDRACFDLADSPLLQAKFYWLKKRSRQILAGGVHFTPNYEDEEFTHNERYKVGLDFFLSPNGKALQVVLSNRGNLRIVELSGRLNNTQREIFEKWIGAGSLKSQEALHTTLWESFKLKSVNQKFYDGVSNSFTELLQHLKSIDKDEEEAKLFASRLLGRLLFCWFLRKKGIIDESVGYFNAHGADATAYYKQSLERLFFLTLNTPIDERDELTKQHQKALFPELLVDDQPSLFKTDQKTPYLNGGLFEPHENDWYKDDSLTLPEGFFTNLYDHFEEFNFTTDESSPEYEQIAIDPEMLGRVFESLLATQVDETGQQARKAKGAFYTPREIVSYMCKESLRNYLYNAVNNDEGTKESIDSLLDITDSEWAKSKSNTLRDKVKDNRTQIIDALDAVTILDPACGSGAFPMGMLQLMLKTYERLESRFDPYKTKLSVIQNNIFGVDIEPMAVEISRLRAWLSLIVDEDDPRSVDPLPNLDFKFVCANSLVPLDKEMGLFSDSSLHQKLKDIRTKYFNARKKHTKKALQDEYYKLTSSEQTSLITDDNRTKQLKSFDPFKNSHSANFFDIDHMFGVQEGFDVVIGNPPYVEHKKLKQISRQLKDNYEVYTGSSDLSVYFLEKATNLLKPSGVTAYINTNKFFNTEYGKKLRDFLISREIVQLINFEQVPVFDNVLVSSCIILFKNSQAEKESLDYRLYFKDKKWREDFPPSDFEQYPYAYLEDSEWSFKSEGEQGLKSKLETGSIMLGKLDGVVVRRGLTTGYDPAFLVDNNVKSRFGDSDILKPLLKGEHIKRYLTRDSDIWLINSHNGIKEDNIAPINLPNLYPAVYDHLLRVDNESGGKVMNRSDKGKNWYNLRNCAFLKEFDKPKIIWPLTADKWGFAYDDSGKYLASGSFMLTSKTIDLMFLLGLMNSKVMKYYFMHTGVMTAGGAFTLKKATIDRLPVRLNTIMSTEIATLAKNISRQLQQDSDLDTSPIQDELDNIVYKLYELDDDDISVIEEAVK